MRTLLLHGFLGAPAAWTDLVARAELDAFVPWLVGHGPTPVRCPGGTFDDAVDDIARALPWDSCTLVGYSMGARVALRLLLRHPHRVTRAVLVGVHPGLTDPMERAARRAWEHSLQAGTRTRSASPRINEPFRDNRAFRHKRPPPALASERSRAPFDAGCVSPAFVDAWETLPVLRTVRDVPAERLAARRAWRLSHTAAGIAHALDVLGLGVMPSTWEALARIDVPATLVAGAEDAKFAAVARQMQARLPHAEVRLVARCGHDVALEAPEELARVIRAVEETA